MDYSQYFQSGLSAIAAQLGMTSAGMLWFLQARMDSPPEALDGYSDLKVLWTFPSHTL